jgi:hypothetical protein
MPCCGCLRLEARLAELARAPEDVRANGVVYYALSTQQNKGKDCIDILIRDLSDEDSYNVGGRAMWGMGYGVLPDQQSRVADAALKVFQARTDGYLRKQSLRALTNYGRAEQVEALQAVAQKPGVIAELQTEIGRTIASIRARDSK